MADRKIAYGTATSLTISLNSLGSGSQVVSTIVDNTSNLYLDALVEVLLDPGTAAAPNRVDLYASDSLDGTNESDETNVDNYAYVGSIYVPDTNVIRSRAFSIAQAFGGILPPKWSLIVVNNSGAALAGSGNSAQYRGVYETIA